MSSRDSRSENPDRGSGDGVTNKRTSTLLQRGTFISYSAQGAIIVDQYMTSGRIPIKGTIETSGRPWNVIFKKKIEREKGSFHFRIRPGGRFFSISFPYYEKGSNSFCSSSRFSSRFVKLSVSFRINACRLEIVDKYPRGCTTLINIMTKVRRDLYRTRTERDLVLESWSSFAPPCKISAGQVARNFDSVPRVYLPKLLKSGEGFITRERGSSGCMYFPCTFIAVFRVMG